MSVVEAPSILELLSGTIDAVGFNFLLVVDRLAPDPQQGVYTWDLADQNAPADAAQVRALLEAKRRDPDKEALFMLYTIEKTPGPTGRREKLAVTTETLYPEVSRFERIADSVAWTAFIVAFAGLMWAGPIVVGSAAVTGVRSLFKKG